MRQESCGPADDAVLAMLLEREGGDAMTPPLEKVHPCSQCGDPCDCTLSACECCPCCHPYLPRLEQEIAALRAERDRLHEDRTANLKLADEMQDRAEAAESRLAALEAYVQHTDKCASWECAACGGPSSLISHNYRPGMPVSDHDPVMQPCSCGLAALTETGAG